MALKLKVTYNDGREVDVLVTPRAQVETERKYAGITDAKGVEQSFHLAWVSLNRAGKEPADFETFLDLIAACEVKAKDGDRQDPTTAAPPSGESSD